MRIAHVNMFYAPTFGGVEMVMQELAERQAAQGHEVHVFCCDSDKYKRIKKKEEIINNIHVHRSRYWFRLSLSTFIWPGIFLKFIKQKKFDIIHSHVSGHAYVLFAGIIAKISGARHVHTTHCPWTDKYRRKILRILVFLNEKIFNHISFRLIDKVVAITPWEYSILKKWVPISEVVNIPNGMDKSFFSRIKNNNFKKKYNIPNGKMVLFFGRLNPTKGPDVLAEVGTEIVNVRKDISFVFVGPDEGKEQDVKNIIKDQPRMFLLGAITGYSERQEMYQAADVYVLPSYREGLPLTIFEAMASKLPIIASPCNGVPYEVKDGVNGFLVDYGDRKTLKQKILEVLDNKELADKFAGNNELKAKSFDWDLISQRYMEEAYNE
ncbi:MAG: glycosyltransferase family 4 protein [Nanoarchaeota archaeon]